VKPTLAARYTFPTTPTHTYTYAYPFRHVTESLDAPELTPSQDQKITIEIGNMTVSFLCSCKQQV